MGHSGGRQPLCLLPSRGMEHSEVLVSTEFTGRTVELSKPDGEAAKLEMNHLWQMM